MPLNLEICRHIFFQFSFFMPQYRVYFKCFIAVAAFVVVVFVAADSQYSQYRALQVDYGNC